MKIQVCTTHITSFQLWVKLEQFSKAAAQILFCFTQMCMYAGALIWVGVSMLATCNPSIFLSNWLHLGGVMGYASFQTQKLH